MANTCCFDPFVTQNPLAEAVDIKKIKSDYIFVSHAHFDHITDAVAIAAQTGATVVSNFEVVSWLGNNGVKNTRPLNPGGTYSSEFGLVKCVPLPWWRAGGRHEIASDPGHVYEATLHHRSSTQHQCRSIKVGPSQPTRRHSPEFGAETLVLVPKRYVEM